MIRLSLFLIFVWAHSACAYLYYANWLMGRWETRYNGKVTWPTVPRMTYGEVLEIKPADVSNISGLKLLNYTSSTWSHSTKDRFLDTYGFMTIDQNKNVVFMTTGSSGFSTVERSYSPLTYGHLKLYSESVSRISIAREIPVLNIIREYKLHNSTHLEHIIQMKTIQHPKDNGFLEHSRVMYVKTKDYY